MNVASCIGYKYNHSGQLPVKTNCPRWVCTLLTTLGNILGVAHHPPGFRLRQIRQDKGLSLDEVAEAAGTTPTQISRLERGERRLSTYWLDRILPILGANAVDVFSDSDENKKTVAVVGFIDQGEQVSWAEGDLGDVVPPAGAEGTNAIEVRSDAMWPRYQPGDFLFFFPVESGVAADCIGKDCVIKTKDGGTYVRRIMRGTRADLYRLASYRGPDIEDVEVLWASRVVSIKLG